MKTLYFRIGHRDLIGGGQLALYHLAVALQDLFDVHLSSDFHPGMEAYEYMKPPKVPFKIGKPEKINLDLACSYTENLPPLREAGRSVLYTFFPRYAWNISPEWHHVLTISRYSQWFVQERWRRDSQILVGGVFSEDYRPEPDKENLMVSCSRFFMEGDPERLIGHSKNQHILIQAFRAGAPPDWKLALAGSVLTEEDRRYYEKCVDLAGGDQRIEFFPMAGKDLVRSLYARAKVFLHAMGYGRNDLAETEHFGFVVEKALLSGCYTIVHSSGGAVDMAHRTFNTVEDLAEKIGEASRGCYPGNRQIANDNRYRTFDSFKRVVEKTFSSWR